MQQRVGGVKGTQKRVLLSCPRVGGVYCHSGSKQKRKSGVNGSSTVRTQDLVAAIEGGGS